jgi:hypothetical protein
MLLFYETVENVQSRICHFIFAFLFDHQTIHCILKYVLKFIHEDEVRPCL